LSLEIGNRHENIPGKFLFSLLIPAVAEFIHGAGYNPCTKAGISASAWNNLLWHPG
jgi:hypothetical protein